MKLKRQGVYAGSPAMMRAIHAVNQAADVPTYHRVFDKVFVRLTPELGALLCLLYPDHDFEIQEGIHAEEG